MTQYAVVRTNKVESEYVFAEIEAGRLRQGWGWLPEQDLRLLLAKRRAGERFTKYEQAAWRNRRLLADTWKGLKEGDILIAPNVPRQGRWVLLRVAGPYSFSPGKGGDHGHLLPVEPVRNKDGAIALVDPNAPIVDAQLRGTMRTMSRVWSVDRLGSAIESIIATVEAGGDVSVAQTAEQKRDAFFSKASDAMTEVAWQQLSADYRGAEFEHLLIPMLESVYGGGTVEHLGGPNEKGADLMVTTRGPLGITYKTAIQVKMYKGTLDDLHPVEQLRQAREEHGVQAAVLLTTAVDISESVRNALYDLSEELKIDVQAWARSDVARLLFAHLGRPASGEGHGQT